MRCSAPGMKRVVRDGDVPSFGRLEQVRGTRDVAWAGSERTLTYAGNEHVPFSVLEKIASICLVKVVPGRE